MKPELLKYRLRFILLAALILLSGAAVASEKTIDELTGEDKEKFDKYRDLFQNGSPDEFYTYANEYEKELKAKGYRMLYYKLQNNEGFFALRHNMMFRAMQVAERLDGELRKDGAYEYFYLATGLMGDIYYMSHDRVKAEQYLTQAIEEAGERDPKFTMRCYQSLAELLSLKDPEEALKWMEKSIELAQKIDNTEYYSLSLAMTAYIHFLDGSASDFYRYYDRYQSLRSMERAGFSHRYDKMMEIGKLAFDDDIAGAFRVLKDHHTIYVDSSLVAIRLYAMARDIDNGFQAMKRRYLEMDSVFSVSQAANYDQMASERLLMRSREEADVNKKQVRSLTKWLVVLVVAFLIIYVMGRRRLMRKIWARNRELKVALAKAEESDHMKSAFISSMSHEIRTPLNAITGFSQLLCTPEYELSDEEKLDMQQRIKDNTHQITSIINEVLELSKTESESTVSEEDKTDIFCNDLCRSVLREVKGQQQAGVKLRFSSNVKDDFKIHTSNYRLKSALTHLVDNAVKFTTEGYIEVRCERTDDQHLRFMVTDTGIGVKPEDRGRIFETFAKGDDFKEGIGLGLPICMRLMKSLKGQLELDETYSDGSRFVITLPLS